MMRVRGLIVGLIAAACMVVCPRARAETVILASTDHELRGALTAALAPAGIDVVVTSDGSSPAAADVVASSRRVAAEQGAEAVVLVLPAEEGATIFVYDRDTDRLLVRPLASSLPLGAGPAAAAAMMVRTMLRALRVTPDVNAAPPRADQAPSLRARAAGDSTLASEVRPSPRIVVQVGPAGWLGDAPVTGGWRLAAAAVFYGRRIGVGVGVAGGPPSEIDSTMFAGDFGDTAAWISLVVPFRLTPRLRVEGAAGGALHITTLRGALQPDAAPVDELHVDPALRFEALAAYRLSSMIAVAVSVSAESFLVRERFLDGPEQVASSPAVQVGLAVRLEVAIR